ncbi:MAG: sulfur oxidation c-type cytochrome SoxX [Pseudomonadota bacterium]|nr:sulfur oxidation c-type cytochrome SoxX [Pseudomonadota bacterium]
MSAAAAAFALSGCVVPPPPPAKNYDAMAQAVIHSSFSARGEAKLDRLNQDPLQKICSAEAEPSAETVKQLEAEQLLTVKWPTGAKYLGDWREGERLAQNGRGMTWSDAAEAPVGGNCYNCHQIGKAEISYGTIGPSLYNYGKLRGVSDPYSRSAAPIVTYTWGKLYNAKAYNACSTMPRFGHVLSEKQMQDLMALLLDPKSPVNQ